MYAEVVNALTSTEERIERTEQQEKQTPVRNKEPLWPMHLISLSLHSEFPFFINYFFSLMLLECLVVRSLYSAVPWAVLDSRTYLQC